MARLANSLLFTFLLFVATARADLLVTTSWLQQHRLDRHLVVVEVGDRAAYEATHIAGARFIALADLLVVRDGIPNELPPLASLQRVFSDAGIGNRDSVVIYSRDIVAATRMFFTLDYLGHRERTSVLDGGFAKWFAENRPVDSGPAPRVRRADFEVFPRPETVVSGSQLRRLVSNSEWYEGTLAIIDARSADQFSWNAGGHIDGAVNVPQLGNFTADAIPVFRSVGELRELYRRAGVPESAVVLVYCRTGMEASVTYFVLRYLEREVSLYDGSYVEWSRVNLT